jgi:hypothetical protein
MRQIIISQDRCFLAGQKNKSAVAGVLIAREEKGGLIDAAVSARLSGMNEFAMKSGEDVYGYD